MFPCSIHKKSIQLLPRTHFKSSPEAEKNMPSSTRRAIDRFQEGSSASDPERSSLDPRFELPRRERNRNHSGTKPSRSGRRRQQSRSRSRSRGGTTREERVLGSNRSKGYGPIKAPPPVIGRPSPIHRHSSPPRSDFEFTSEEDEGRGSGWMRAGRGGGGGGGGGWWDKQIPKPICGKHVSHGTLVMFGVVSLHAKSPRKGETRDPRSG